VVGYLTIPNLLCIGIYIINSNDMTERQLNTLVESIIGDNELVVNVGEEGRCNVQTQDGDWVAAYGGDINFFLWPEFVKSNGVFDMLKEEDQIELLYGLYGRVASIVKEYIPNPSILDSLEYCCKLTGGFLFTRN
jgi:hypothetical protein